MAARDLAKVEAPVRFRSSALLRKRGFPRVADNGNIWPGLRGVLPAGE